jgi:hypothetical protein
MGAIDGIERADWGPGGESRAVAPADNNAPTTNSPARFPGVSFDSEARWARERHEAPPKRPDFNFDKQGREIVQIPKAIPVPADQNPLHPLLRDGYVAEYAPTSGEVLEPLLRTWDNEGGREALLTQAKSAASNVLDAAGNSSVRLLDHFDGLPDAIQTKAFDVMRLTPRQGEDGVLDRLDQFERSLTPQEWPIVERWAKQLTPAEWKAIVYGLGVWK